MSPYPLDNGSNITHLFNVFQQSLYSALFNRVETRLKALICVETRLTNCRLNLSSVISIAVSALLLNPGPVALELRRLPFQVCHSPA